MINASARALPRGLGGVEAANDPDRHHRCSPCQARSCCSARYTSTVSASVGAGGFSRGWAALHGRFE
jgi:hypothetical protein